MKRPYLTQQDRWFIIHEPELTQSKALLLLIAKLKLYRELYNSLQNVLGKHHL